MTVVGTRPEIIRLAATIKRLDAHTDHVLVHTGQNYDYELNGVFFEDLGLRRPDHFLEADTTSLGTVLGTILMKMEQVLLEEKPDAMLVLGDTNSCISALMARRLKIPVFHMEAGNRCFDENVPEEVNRRLVDHVADYNLVYTEHARRNLLSEGIHPSRILLTGSPMREVLEGNQLAVSESDVMIREELQPGEFFLVSIHREENVDNSARLTSILEALNALADTYDVPVLVSTHPRTLKRLESQAVSLKSSLRFHAPFGFNDYIRLQTEAKLVLSDSGTISEECSILGFRAVTLRDFIERPEALDAGVITTAGVETTSILDAVAIALTSPVPGRDVPRPAEYSIMNTSLRTLNFIRSTAHSHRARTGIRSDS
jgi:UDP-N-acetylglucosamine 2-epimerase (non-hydrolysing)